MDFLEMLQANVPELLERDFTTAQRKKAAESGTAMPDGSFPIENEEDLHNAVQAVGRAKDPAKAKAHIKARAKALGCTSCLPKEWEESQRRILANVEQLEEAGTTYQPSTGNLTLTVIKPGWSKNNRYYPAHVLTKSAGLFEGAKMFVDHYTEAQDKQRPEGSVKDWVGTISGVHVVGGAVKATANIHNEDFKQNLANLKKAGNLSQMGISIRAFGETKSGEAEGRKGTIVESVLGCKSVDFVTFAAAGGVVESMSEAVDPDDVMLLSLDDLKKKRPDLVEALTKKETPRTRKISKNNGSADSWVEGSPFNNQLSTTNFTETDVAKKDPYAKVDGLMVKHMKHPVTRQPLTEAEQRKALGILHSKEIEPELAKLTARQRNEFNHLLKVGLNEADALKLATIPIVPCGTGRPRTIQHL
jgi:hypothetical protein